MQLFDIPINIKVQSNTEEEAEEIVKKIMDAVMNKPALERSVVEWDYFVFLGKADPFND